jgi:hypothetical protein
MKPKDKKRMKPPYKGSLVIPVFGGQKTVRLPKVEGFQIGERAEVEYEYKDRPQKLKLIRIEGGWDIAEGR